MFAPIVRARFPVGSVIELHAEDMEAVDAAVILPSASMVRTGIAVDPP